MLCLHVLVQGLVLRTVLAAHSDRVNERINQSTSKLVDIAILLNTTILSVTERIVVVNVRASTEWVRIEPRSSALRRRTILRLLVSKTILC
jgi:hypothetical protein